MPVSQSMSREMSAPAASMAADYPVPGSLAAGSRPGTIEEAAAVPGALGRRLTLELEPAAGSDAAPLVTGLRRSRCRNGRWRSGRPSMRIHPEEKRRREVRYRMMSGQSMHMEEP